MTAMNTSLISAALLSVALAATAAERDPRIGDVVPVTPAEKVERALNGTFGFPPSPAVPWTADDRGFAKDRLFHVPAPGQHPRILFGAEDLPRIRTHLAGNEAGIATTAALRAMLAKGIGTKGTWEEQCHTALVAGDLAAFTAAFKEDPTDNVPPGSGFKYSVPGRKPATKWGTRNPLLACLEVQAFLAQLDGDAAAGTQAAKALATYARFVSPKIDAANAKPGHEFHWTSTRDLVPIEIAYGYDWAWTWMTPAQRDDVRSAIVRATVGKYTVGMDLPSHWRNWNHIAITDSFLACLFAIEGEPGDDPRGRERMFEVYRDYLTYAIDGLGFGTEGIGYQTVGIARISGAMVSFANRGRNLLTHPHWRRHSESWLVQALQPFGGAWQSNSDLANFPPNLGMVQIQKFFFPQSAGIDLVLRNHPQVMTKDWGKLATDGLECQWIMATAPDAEGRREQAQQEAAALVGGGLTFHDRERGSLYTRTGWGSDDLSLHVDCRTDTTFPSHDHADRGQFTLAALGRAWACDGYRDTEGKYHNVVTIDGRGQGYFASPGRWIAAEDGPQATTAIVDAKYNWDWQWTKSMFTESKASLEGRGQAWGVEPALRQQARIPLDRWEIDPTPSVLAYYQGFADRAHGDPRMWDDEDGWQIRAPWYPVQKAFRTVTLARGKHPYVLVVDDIRKDDAEHLYEWRMNAGPEVAAVTIDGADIVLGDSTTARAPGERKYAFQGKTDLAPAKGDRLLLVRTLDIGQPDMPTLQPVPMVATVEYKKTDDMHQFSGRSMGLGTQVVIGSRSVEPKFVVLLYPYRQGEEVPKTAWNDGKTRLTVTWKDQADTYDVSVTAEGRRVFSRK